MSYAYQGQQPYQPQQGQQSYQPGQQPYQPQPGQQPYQPYQAPQVVVGFPSSFILRYTPHEEPDLAVPYELKSFFSDDVWAARIPAITRKASRYYKKGIEWVWLILGFATLIGVPIAVYYVALQNLPEDPDDKKDDDDDHFFHWHGFDRAWKARIISLATWVVLMFIVFMPMKIWKSGGKAQVNKMMQQWEAEDKAVRPEGAPYPTLKMKQPGIISKSIKISVTIPPGPAPSIYQPSSQVPPYLANPPTDPAASQYYQQPPQQPAGQWGPPSAGYSPQPPYGSDMAQAPGSVPMYNAHDERVPSYSGMPVSQMDEKNPFEDVKV